MQAQNLLAKLRVIDLSQYIPGPLATRQLADLGADVIKIEPPGGDPMRHFMNRDADGVSPIYKHLNRGKRVCSLDLKDDAERAILRDLLAGADILLESFRPGVLARLGFDRDALAEINPRLIHCALSGYGQTGPWAQRAGHDINYCALTAQASVNGTAERPVIGFPPIADHASALQAAISMLAALHARDLSEDGIFIDLSISESLLAWQYLPLLGEAPKRAASILNGGAACYNIYRCADDRFISLGAIEAVFWENFCSAVNRPRWIERQFEVMPQQALIGEVAALVAEHPLAHWRQLLDPVDCCFEALLEIDEIAQQPQLLARRALGPNGPAYPAWINRQPVEIAPDIEQVGSSGSLDWKMSESAQT